MSIIGTRPPLISETNLYELHHVPIHHPSYIYVYRRKRIDEYINEVERIIKRLL